MARDQSTGATSYGGGQDVGIDTVGPEGRARDKFGGMNIGAGFFGWLVAMAIAILLISIIGAIAAGAGASSNVTQSHAQRQAGTIGIVAGMVLVAVLLVAYYTGGYVAGRMSRFDGASRGWPCGSSAWRSRSSPWSSGPSLARSTTSWTGSAFPG